MRKTVLAVCLVLISLALGSGITFSQYKRTLTLQEALSLAAENNSDLIVARLDRLKASERVSQVYSENLFPSITLNSTYTRAFKKQVFVIAGQTFEIGSDNSISNSVAVTESLPILGTPVFTGVRIAEYYEKLSAENVNSTANRIKSNVKKAYFGVLFAKEIVDINALRLANSEQNLSVVEARYRNGAATEFEYLRARVNVDNNRPALEKSQADLELSRKALKNTIGLKTNEDIEVTGNLTYDSLEVFGTTRDLLTKIAEDNVAIRQLRITNLINKELVDVDKSNYLPRVYLFGNYNLAAGENDDRSLSEYRFYNVINAGIGLSWDLNIFKNDFKVHQSEIEVKKTEEQIANLQQVLRVQGESILIRLEDARNRIRSQQETVALAERGLELANISFQSGVLRQIDVLDAEFSLSQARLAYNQAIYDYQVAKADLEELLEK